MSIANSTLGNSIEGFVRKAFPSEIEALAVTSTTVAQVKVQRVDQPLLSMVCGNIRVLLVVQGKASILHTKAVGQTVVSRE